MQTTVVLIDEHGADLIVEISCEPEDGGIAWLATFRGPNHECGALKGRACSERAVTGAVQAALLERGGLVRLDHDGRYTRSS